MRRKVIAVSSLIVVLAMALWTFWPPPGYDIQRVDSRLRALQPPYRSVRTAYYMDGGSVGIEIIDRGGSTGQFAIPIEIGNTGRYTKVFAGALHHTNPGAVEIAEPLHTKRMLLQILRDYPNRTAWDDSTLLALDPRPPAFVRCLIRKFRGDYRWKP